MKKNSREFSRNENLAGLCIGPSKIKRRGGDPKSGKINSSDLLSIDLLGHVDLLCCQGALEACAPL